MVTEATTAATEATTAATEVSPEIKVQATCDAESWILNKEIEHEITYEDVYCIDFIFGPICWLSKTCIQFSKGYFS